VGFGRLDTLWKRMGFYFNLDNTPSLAMGTAEASILELAVAYSAFSNGGFRISPQKILSIEAPDGIVIWKNSFRQPKFRVLATRTCQLMNAILQKAVREGTGSALNSTYGVTLPMAGKTGTSQDYTDAWFAAYNPSLVMVSRAGASMPSVRFYSEKYGTGSALALPLVALTLKGIQGDNRTAGQFNSYFPPLEPDLADELACPDFKEKDILDDFLDFFTTEEISYDSLSDKPARRKRSFFKRIFGSREKD
jgi:penicillin-binding protein 1A